jgi:hypothetical protein
MEPDDNAALTKKLNDIQCDVELDEEADQLEDVVLELKDGQWQRSTQAKQTLVHDNRLILPIKQQDCRDKEGAYSMPYQRRGKLYVPQDILEGDTDATDDNSRLLKQLIPDFNTENMKYHIQQAHFNQVRRLNRKWTSCTDNRLTYECDICKLWLPIESFNKSQRKNMECRVKSDKPPKCSVCVSRLVQAPAQGQGKKNNKKAKAKAVTPDIKTPEVSRSGSERKPKAKWEKDQPTEKLHESSNTSDSETESDHEEQRPTTKEPPYYVIRMMRNPSVATVDVYGRPVIRFLLIQQPRYYGPTRVKPAALEILGAPTTSRYKAAEERWPARNSYPSLKEGEW